MEKIKYSDNVHMLESEYIKLLEKFGVLELEKRIKELNESKIEDPKRVAKIKSDYRAILSEGMKLVQPIRDPEKIKEMGYYLKRNSYRDYILFMIGINTGYRISDLVRLRVADVRNKERITVKEEKTDKIRPVKINKKLKEEIEQYIHGMKDDEYLFKSRQGNKPYSRVRAYQILNKAAVEAELSEIGTHTLRKTFGYHFYKSTKDVATLQMIFNHSDPKITLRYIGITQEEIDAKVDGFSIGF